MNASRNVRCGRCGVTHSPSAYASLDELVTLDAHDLAPLVVEWPRGLFVEVRRCGSCGTPIARLKPGERTAA
jgi:hypothetical protein